MDDEKLIAEVEKYPELYDPLHKNYAKQSRRDNCWMEIAVQMKSTAKDVRKRWLALRAMHRRAIKKKHETSSGQDATSSKKWRFEDQMNFLKLNVNEETIPNIDERSQNSEESNESNGDEDEVPIKIEYEDVSCLLSPSYESSTSSTSKGRKRRLLKSKPKQHKDISVVSVFQDYLDKQQKLEKKSELEDPIIHFFISMGKIVKNFTPYQQAIVKGRVYQIINEIELNSNAGSSQPETLNYHDIPPFPGQNHNY